MNWLMKFWGNCYWKSVEEQVILQSDAVLDDSQELDIECRKRTERSDARVITK